MDEWVNKLAHLKNGSYLALERNELSVHEKTWRNCKSILLNEMSQHGMVICCVVSTIEILDNVNLRGQEINRINFWEGGGMSRCIEASVSEML